MSALARIPWAVGPAALVLAFSAALVELQVPPEATALAVAGVALLLAAGVWALVDLERFVLLAVLGAMALPAALLQPGGAQVALADLLLLIGLFAWLVRTSVGTRDASWTAGNRLLAPTLLFAAVTGASLAWSVSAEATAVQTVQVVEIAVVLPLVFASLPSSLRSVRTGLLFYVGVTCVLAIVTLALSGPQVAKGDVTGLYLPGDLHKNAIGSFLAVGLVLAYAHWLSEPQPRARRLLGLAALIELAGLLMTISRGAIVGAVLAVLVVSALLRRGRVLTLGLAAAVVITAVLVGIPTGSERLPQGGYESALVREYSYANAVEKIRERPLLGTGAGTYWDFIPELEIGLADPNNMFLLTWAEIGLVGLAALLFLLYRFGRFLVGASRLPPAAAVPAVAAGASVVAMLVHFQFDATWTRGTTSVAFAMMGLVLAAGRLAPRPGGLPRPGEQSVAAASPTVKQQVPATAESPEAAGDTVGDSNGPRVLHVVTSSAFAGIERHVVRLLRELRALGCMAELACPPSAARLREEAVVAGIPVHPPAGRRSGPWIGAVAQHVAAERPEIIHLHDGRSAVAGMLLGPLGRGLVVRTQHFTRPASVERSGWRRGASLWVHRMINRKLDGYVAVSQSVADAAVGRHETHDAGVVVIPPGIELPDGRAVALAQALREGLAHPVVAYIGRLEPEKRLEVLLRAVPGVLDELPDCRFVLAGSGGAEEGLRRLARMLDIGSAVTWTGEVLEPGSVLEGAHVYVNPSPAEGFGLATAEAMAYALPVVAIASAGSGEIVDDGVTGLLVPAQDAAALATAIVRLAGDLPAAAQIGLAARRRAVSRFGIDDTARATLDFYRRLLGLPPP